MLIGSAPQSLLVYSLLALLLVVGTPVVTSQRVTRGPVWRTATTADRSPVAALPAPDED